MFIQTEATPNPDTVKCLPGLPVAGFHGPFDYPDAASAKASLLARALFQVDGRFHALDGICPHQGGPLGRGTVCGGIVTCPCHGWLFDGVTGQHQANRSLQQPGFPVKVEGQDIFVAVNE